MTDIYRDSDALEELNEIRKDALQEIFNISMGQAADSLACLVKDRVHLSVPQMHWVDKMEVNDLKSAMKRVPKGIIICQPFSGYLKGEILVCYEKDTDFTVIGESLAYSKKEIQKWQHELLLDITNILGGACLRGVAEQLDIRLEFGAPNLIDRNNDVTTILLNPSSIWDKALMMEIGFSVQSMSMTSDILICMPEQYINKLFKCIEHLLE